MFAKEGKNKWKDTREFIKGEKFSLFGSENGELRSLQENIADAFKFE